MRTRITRFNLTEDHIKLLRRAYVRWNDAESGAPEIDCKRPYGSSGVESDVAEILGWDENRCPHCDEPIDESMHDRAREIHQQTEVALQILLKHGKIEPGVYTRGDSWSDRGWEPEAPAP